MLTIYQRPVNWTLWSPIQQAAMIIIPEEAERLIPVLRKRNRCCMHFLTYIAPVTRKMLHFNDPTYQAIPPLPDGWKAPTWLTIELGILGGRLYFEFEEYAAPRSSSDSVT